MRALAPAKNAPEHDMVMTPPALAKIIVDHFSPSGPMLDPCRGEGAFFDAMKRRKSGPVSWCEISEGVDFLASTKRVTWIITNPPWSKIRAFLSHAMSVADEVVFLATMVHFVTRARMADVHSAGFGYRQALLLKQPLAPWPSSGFQLVAMHLSRGYRGGMAINRSLIGD